MIDDNITQNVFQN